MDVVLDHLLDLPKLPALFRVERAIAVLGAVVWLLRARGADRRPGGSSSAAVSASRKGLLDE
jgi:hypothetical protein